MTHAPLRIMGVDPGSRVTGFGVVASDGTQIMHVAHGVIDLKSVDLNLNERLPLLGQAFREIMAQYQVDAVVVESIFLGKNPDSAFKLGHARGVLIYEAGLKPVQVFEYATRSVKKSLTGSGAAQKDQVEWFLRSLLRVEKVEPLDASDALAMACHHAIVSRNRSLFANARDL